MYVGSRMRGMWRHTTGLEPHPKTAPHIASVASGIAGDRKLDILDINQFLMRGEILVLVKRRDRLAWGVARIIRSNRLDMRGAT
jgi:hypothetical protein